ncbi:unnamed protein product, partial [Durusdinium trenchii]
EAYFGWIAEYGLQADVLPSRWSMHVEPQTGRLYYVNSEDGSSSWENPLTESCLRPVIDIGRGYLQAPSDGYFEEQKMALWAAHKHNLEGWHGPHVDEDGREYYANSELNVSSWQDPREETQSLGLKARSPWPSLPVEADGVDHLLSQASLDQGSSWYQQDQSLRLFPTPPSPISKPITSKMDTASWITSASGSSSSCRAAFWMRSRSSTWERPAERGAVRADGARGERGRGAVERVPRSMVRRLGEDRCSWGCWSIK